MKDFELDTLLFYNDRYIKTKIKTYSNKVYINLHGLNVAENGVECESFTVISIESLLVYDIT